MLRHLFGDIRYAARRLAATPGFTAAAVITIALGVGINTGIFSVFNGLALRELPAADADELVSIHQVLDENTLRTQRSRSGAASTFSTAEYRAYRDATRALSGLMAYSRALTPTLGSDSPQEIRGTLVTCNYFDVLRQPPALGPGFANDCDAEGAAPTIVLGHDLWTNAFGADPAVVGREVRLNRQSFAIVGVAPQGARGVDMVPMSFFAPISAEPLLNVGSIAYGDENWSWLTLVGRKADDTSLEQVRAELGVIAAQIDAQQPPRRTALVVDRARVGSEPEGRAEVLAASTVVLTAFGLVLLIACANVANLLLARATGRSREIAVRLSLGASRGRIVQQLLAETVLIALLGGVLGSMLAAWSFQGIVALAMSALPADAPPLAIDASPDVHVLGFALLATLASGVLFGLAPALQASKPDLHTAMKADVTGAGRRSGSRLQSALVGMQVAVCMVLMVAAGLLLRGLQATQAVEPGFEYERVAVASFDLAGAGYDAARAAAFQRQLVERVGSQPGVDAVAQSFFTPLDTGGGGFTVRLPDQEQWFPIRTNIVSPEFFSLLEIPIVRGRTFTEAELTEGSDAIIVTEATARRLWQDREPIGQLLTRALSNPFAAGRVQTGDLRVVGVAKDAQIAAIGEIPSSYVYMPALPPAQISQRLLVQSRIDFAETAAGIRAAAAALDPTLVVRVVPLEANLEIWRGLARIVSSLSSALGVLALVLASVGIYGVVAYAVGRRVREIGIRVALGANARSVVALMLKRTMRPVVVGAVIGAAGALGVSRILSSVLFGVSPFDPVALLGAVFVVAAIAFAAGAVPARRAARVDPTRTLHYE
jgi:predicted permease